MFLILAHFEYEERNQSLIFPRSSNQCVFVIRAQNMFGHSLSLAFLNSGTLNFMTRLQLSLQSTLHSPEGQ